MRCAHLVPRSFKSKELDYLFGIGDAALESERNAIFLAKAIENGFDSGYVVFVPDGTIDSIPIQWKCILLDDSVRDIVIFNQYAGETLIGEWKWGVGQLLT